MYTLGIETSCDETSCAILRNYSVLSNVTVSSLREHKKYGGIVPEIATRAHLKNIDKICKESLKRAKLALRDIDLIAVTYKPGLIGALVVGVNFAKALALSLKIPFVGVDHLQAHLFAPFLNYKVKLKFPFLGVVVSGGHTEIYQVNDFVNIRVIGRTSDDACGEVFDKVAKVYGLSYPGGPLIDKIFNPQYKNEFKFKCGRRGFNLSFSGIKTALVYKKMELEKKGVLDEEVKIKLLSSFQESVVNVLVETIVGATDRFGIRRVVCGGGVIANRYLRKRLKQIKNIDFLIAPLPYAGDNAAVVAGLGFYRYNNKGIQSKIGLKEESN
jgi:N6-L-threonylcarbamoyladenine synthase